MTGGERARHNLASSPLASNSLALWRFQVGHVAADEPGFVLLAATLPKLKRLSAVVSEMLDE